VYLEGRNSSSFLFVQTFSFLKRKSLEGKQPDSWSQLKYDNLPLTFSSSPQSTQLFQNFPNPFNPETWIPYQLTKGSHVNIDIYDFRGQLIRRLPLGEKEGGIYIDKAKAAHWDGKNEKGEKSVSGIYLYILSADSFQSEPGKMLLLK
jgi:hypothetical protein